MAASTEYEVGGESTNNGFQPQLDISRWSKEIKSEVRLIHDESNPIITSNTDIIRWQGNRIDCNFYEVLDGFEFEVVLKERPTSNVLSFSIQTKGLVFWYQPELTKEEIARGAIRPDNVVGSYAVYHATRRGDFSKCGGENYQAGKAFHIYRPHATDAAGNRVWCDLNIDVPTGLMTITIPQNFLARAVYPIVVDPTFGRTTVGTTSNTYNDEFFASGFGVPSGAGALTLDNLTMALNAPSAYAAKFTLYNNSAGTPPAVGSYATSPVASCIVSVTRTTAPVNPEDWTVGAMASQSLTSGLYYWCCFNLASGAIVFRYDSAPAYTSWLTGQLYAAFPTNPAPSAGGWAQAVSIYATYSEAVSSLSINVADCVQAKAQPV